MEQRKIILWSITLFFGSWLLFRGIDSVVSGTLLSLAIQGAALVVIIGAVVLLNRRRS